MQMMEHSYDGSDQLILTPEMLSVGLNFKVRKEIVPYHGVLLFLNREMGRFHHPFHVEDT